jgi:NADH-quinone oxidoreductase subunit C
VDINELKRKLEAVAPGTILDYKSLEGSKEKVLWVELSSIAQIAHFLKGEPTLKLDQLENLSAHESQGKIVLSYFLRSSTTGKAIILRGALSLKSDNAEVEAPSVAHLWALAKPFEQEIFELFGVRFLGGETAPHQVLPEGWRGFPLRKSYVFPAAFLSIKHERIGHS